MKYQFTSFVYNIKEITYADYDNDSYNRLIEVGNLLLKFSMNACTWYRLTSLHHAVVVFEH